MILVGHLEKGKPAERLSAQSHGSSLPPHSAKVPKTAGLPKGVGKNPDRSREMEGKKMKRSYLVVGVMLSVCATAPAVGEDLAVGNASFEDYVLPAGNYTLNGVGLDPWIPEPGEQVGVWNLSDFTDYPDGAPDGVHVAYSQGPSISQVLSDVVVQGMTYALTVEVGKSPCCPFDGYGVQLLADGVLLAEDANSIPPDPATFETVVVTYTSPPGDPSAGDPLEIRLLALGPEVAFDHVRLTATDDAYPDWELLDSGSAMSRLSAGAVYDSARGVLVMFGGRDATALDDTWEYDGISWSQVLTPTSPPARFWHAMVYDSNRERVVLFGGGDPDNTIYYNDTWEYDGSDWQQITTAIAPPEMQVKTMVFDSERNLTVLVGGQGPGGTYTDTWEYDGSNWMLVNTPDSPPAPDTLAAMAYDAARDRTVLAFNNL